MEGKKFLASSWSELKTLGILAILISIPVLLWRSLGIGKRGSYILVVLTVVWSAGKVVDFYFEKVHNRIVIERETNETLRTLFEFKENIRVANEAVLRDHEFIKKGITEKSAELFKSYRESTAEISREIGTLEKAISVVRREMQESLIERLVALKERIKILGESIDKKENRLEVESLMDNLNILPKEQRKRFLKDMKELGFSVDEKIQGIENISRNPRFISSMDIVSVMASPFVTPSQFVSCDMTTVLNPNYNQEGDEQ